MRNRTAVKSIVGRFAINPDDEAGDLAYLTPLDERA